MAGPAKQPEKRQASLTSFFTPKTINGLTQQPHKQPSQEGSNGGDDDGNSPSRKRPLEDDADHGNEATTPALKRAKSKDDRVPDKKSTLAPRPPPNHVHNSSAVAKTSRTEHYAYDVDRPQAAVGDVEDDDEEAAVRSQREELHRKFVKKLGHPDSMAMIRRRNFQTEDETAAQDEDGEGDEAEEDEGSRSKNTKKKGAKTGKLTPMEIQFLDIKRKHLDTVLIVEVGYKFRFFGEDARVAAKELSIVCIPGKFRYDERKCISHPIPFFFVAARPLLIFSLLDPSEAHLDRFASASIPVHRLPVHAKRLVAAGHKVGVVRQVETAALKKAGDNRNAPFVRKLTNVYTKGTYIDEIGELDKDSSGAPPGGYLLCITETKAKGWGTDEKVDVGIFAVQPATGDIIHDNFEDGFMRREIETRLLHISPCEFLIVGELTKATDKLLQHLSGTSSNVFGDRTRIEKVPRSKTMAAEAYSHVTQFYANKLKDKSDERAAALLDKILKLPESVTICLSAMITHLTEYGLEHIFDLTKYFASFTTRSHMLINGTTLESLEVYRNSTDHQEKGSLLWAIDKTHTRFGQRLLRKWIGRPLLDKEQLEERVAAVEELVENRSIWQVDKLEGLLVNIKTDLERSLIRIYYGKCSRPELLSVLQSLQKISMNYTKIKKPEDTGLKSSLLSNAICAIPQIGEIVVTFLEKINPEAARRDDKYEFFRELEETDDISNHKLGIAAVEQELDAHRQEAASKLGKKGTISYVTVGGIEFLIEVPNIDLKKVPASWIKISGTKKVSRFHTPEVVRLISERDQHKESLAAACDVAFGALLTSIAATYQPLRDAVSAIATLDCLVSLSKVAALPGYSKPTFLPSSDPPSISIVGGRHPIAEHTLPNGYIPFTTTLCSPTPLAQLITGPNMGGKSSFVRAVALLVLLAQIGSFVPADAMSLTLADQIHTRMGARDNLFAGESTFMVEVSETASILRSATPRSLVVLDELGRGTSTHDGAAIASAVLEHVVRETKCLTLFITHYQNLAKVAEGLGGGLVKNVHMRFTATKLADGHTSESDEESALDGDEEITFLYEVAEGVAHRSYGLNVARLARIPRKVLEVAAQKSRELEDEIRLRRLKGAVSMLEHILSSEAEEEGIEQLISGVEQL